MEIYSGKGSIIELENLHGKVTRVYSKVLDSVVSSIDYSESLMTKYEMDKKKLEEAGESTEDLVRPSEYMIDKDMMAMIKNAQSFLKENDVIMDITKHTIGAKKLRSNINAQISEKMGNN